MLNEMEMSPAEYHYYLMDWAGNRIDDLSTQSQDLYSQAIEEEFFDWFNDRHQLKPSNVLSVPYHKDYNENE